MRGSRVMGMVPTVAALHVVVLSLVFGPRCIPYVVAAYLCAVVVWGGVSMSGVKRGTGFIVGAGVSLAVQQAAYWIWKAELQGCWWPAAQFFAIQLLVGAGVQRTIHYALRLGACEGKKRAGGTMRQALAQGREEQAQEGGTEQTKGGTTCFTGENIVWLSSLARRANQAGTR